METPGVHTPRPSQGCARVPVVAAVALERLDQQIAQGTLKLPLLPAVPMQVCDAAARDDGDTKAIADVIQRDQAMAAHVLTIANSPMYRARLPLITVQHALARLGRVRIREVAMLIACQTEVFRVGTLETQVKQQFRHSVATALCAQEIARQRRANVEEAFLVGLMHDVGRPVLLQALVDLHRELKLEIEPDALLLAAGERHAFAGAALARSWNLIDRVVEAIRQHHAVAPEGPATDLVWCLRLADDMAHLVLDCVDGGAEALAQHPALRPLEIYPDSLARLLAGADAVRENAEAIS